MANLPVVAMTRKGKKKTRKNTRAVMGPATAPRPTKALTQVVNQIVNRKMETKYRAEDIAAEGGTNFNSVISTQADWYRCLPLVGPGTNSHNRIGDSIVPTKLRLDFSFRLGRDSLDYTRDIWVVLYIMTSKNQKAYAANTGGGQLAQNFQQYLDNGDGASTYFNGVWTDSTKPMYQPNNTLLKKFVFNLMKPSGDTNGQELSQLQEEVAACTPTNDKSELTSHLLLRLSQSLSTKIPTHSCLVITPQCGRADTIMVMEHQQTHRQVY